jgi:hypothetical protein
MFKTFPEFTKLTLDDRQEYESYVKDFPPVSDIAFTSLMFWWKGLGDTAVSILNGNLVISYWIAGDEINSGLSLVGTNKVDESICTIFDYLRDKGEKPRVVNIPEFVVNNMRYPELFQFKTDGGGDEYIVSLEKFAVLDNFPKHMRVGIRKFIREFGQSNLRVGDVDINKMLNRQLLLQTSENWPLRGVNHMTKRGREAFPSTVSEGSPLGVKCVGLFVNDELQAHCLYFKGYDSRYITFAHARVNYDIPHIFSYMVHALSAYFDNHGVKYANIYSDNGSVKMRAIKIALRPDHFFRKYSVEPA